MIVATRHGFLIDRLIDARRVETTRRMAEVLIEADAYRVEHDAIMLLRDKGFKPTDVFLLIHDARFEAAQIVLAKEISQP